MTRRLARTSLLLAAAIAGYGSLRPALAVTPITPEFVVNTRTTGHQYRARMSMSPTGEFVVTWTSAYFDGHGFGIAARRFDSLGAPVGAEFVVNSYTSFDQQFSAVSINEAGRFVVVWRSSYLDGSSSGIVAQRFGSNGARQGGEFVVNSHFTGAQSAPDVAVGPQGGFFVVWESNGQDGDGNGIFARRHNSSGTPQATEFQVNLVTVGSQAAPRIVITQPSDLVVLWTSAGSVAGRRLGQDGAVGAEFQIKPSGTGPALAPTGDGGFLAVWQSVDAHLTGVQARRFDLNGNPVGDEIQVNAYTVGSQVDADVAGNGTDFVVVWSSLDQDGQQGGVFARHLDSTGLVGDEFQVHQYTSGTQNDPSTGMRSTGAFVVTWNSSQSQFLTDYDVILRRYSVADLATLDVDGDRSNQPLTDGRLVIRFLFGFSGAALTSDAVGEECSRCDAGEIVSYLEDLGLVLDIDDDGETEPLTDGMLALRFLFLLQGDELTAGAVDDDCERCDAGEIEEYLETLD